MDKRIITEIAKNSGWSKLNNKNKRLVSFIKVIGKGKKDKIRMNIYFTTGTIGICYPKTPESFSYNNTIDDVTALLQNDEMEQEGK